MERQDLEAWLAEMNRRKFAGDTAPKGEGVRKPKGKLPEGYRIERKK